MRLKIYSFFFIYLSSFLIGYSQNKIENIVFEGAGIKGLAYAGVIKVLEENRLIDDLHKVGGTSAGAITALMLSLGYNANEIYAMISSIKFQKFNQGGFGGVNRMKNQYGWYRSDRFSKWLADVIEQKTGNPDITLEQLKTAGFIDLYVVATCLNTQERILLSHETFPKMRVQDAVKISMSTPLYFVANFVDSEGKLYHRKKDREGKNVMVDGGIIGNFPIDIFDSFQVDSDNRENRLINPNTVGIRVDTDGQIAYDKKGMGLEPVPIENFRTFIIAFYTITIESLNRNQLKDEDWNRTISVSSVGIGPKIKRLSDYEKQLLMQSGENAVKEYLEIRSIQVPK